MADRRDALAGAAEAVTALETLARELDRQDGHTVITVGRLEVQPNAVNVIPGRVTFSIDFRARQRGDNRRAAMQRVRALLAEIAAARGLELEVSVHRGASRRFPWTRASARGFVTRRTRLGLTPPGHGQRRPARHGHPRARSCPRPCSSWPSRDGISHNPAEFSRIEDIACAARIVAEAVCRVSGTGRCRGCVFPTSDGMDEAGFVAVCGPLFEGSPWIAARTWPQRPFPSLDSRCLRQLAGHRAGRPRGRSSSP